MKKEVFTEPELQVESFRVQEAIMDDWSDIGEGESEVLSTNYDDSWE